MIKRVKLNSTFYQRYPDKDTFVAMFSASPMALQIATGEIEALYIKMVAEFMHSTFTFIDPLQQDLQTMRRISEYYPNLAKRLAIQDRILTMSIDDISKGGIAVRSEMVQPDTDTVDPASADLPFVSSKALSANTLSEIQALQRQYTMIVDGLWQDFLNKCKDLFIMFVIGTDQLLGMDDEVWNEPDFMNTTLNINKRGDR